ncbi:methyltransferase domain-containing protein [Streptococcus cuniculi]|uniref:Methyltransferase domain-containing protein n=1 Tax=Streptococcus cuniculi TaxID=1432788 RepID=A0A4Y9J951_9STRE|nr:methyltransferase domain-containing protein [Streptococcus cuniculi]MBF0779002.1 methyltransferase domain-containing protein [Streptococcus cuniculi]TFU97051.1 methyltransferase domain-containing protein [Streptococcus cuniculi]
MSSKFLRFAQATSKFICPLCQEQLRLVEQSLMCPKGHCFDISKFGYVNLAPHIRQSKTYDKENFQQRQQVLEAGYYQHILQTLSDFLKDLPEHSHILDVGCGEGYYTRHLKETFPEKDFYAFDLSKHSVQLAAKSNQGQAINWFVADLAQLPIKNRSMDILLDIFSPAHYQEFRRVLAPKGRVFKAIPTSHHLKEIREKGQKADYSNQDIVDHFKEQLEIEDCISATKTYHLTKSSQTALLAMTPLLFHVEKGAIDWSSLSEITISADILVGKARTRLGQKDFDF